MAICLYFVPQLHFRPRSVVLLNKAVHVGSIQTATRAVAAIASAQRTLRSKARLVVEELVHSTRNATRAVAATASAQRTLRSKARLVVEELVHSTLNATRAVAAIASAYRTKIQANLVIK
jgi:hypothetical protein